MRYAYPCILTPEPEGGFFAKFPDVRGALTNGKDIPKTLEMAEDALTVIFCAYVDLGEALPEPSPLAAGQYLVALPPLVAAKLSLYTAMRQQGITPAALAQNLGTTETAVRKLITPDHNSEIDTVMRALRAVGRNLIVEDLAA